MTQIDPNSLYQNTRDDTNSDENGELSYTMFNRELQRAELNLLKFLTGDLMFANDVPAPFELQKNRDYLAHLITRKSFQGDFKLPDDYYTFQYLYKKGKRKGCDSESSFIPGCDRTVPLREKDVIDGLCSSNIKSLRPTGNKPVARMVENGIEFYPQNIGSVTLEYIRYPKFGELKTRFNPQYNSLEYDPAASIMLEWGEWAREPLIWFIVNKYSVHIRERSLKEFNLADKPRG